MAVWVLFGCLFELFAEICIFSTKNVIVCHLFQKTCVVKRPEQKILSHFNRCKCLKFVCSINFGKVRFLL